MKMRGKIRNVFVPLLWVELRDGLEVETQKFLHLLIIEDKSSIPWAVNLAADVFRFLTIPVWVKLNYE